MLPIVLVAAGGMAVSYLFWRGLRRKKFRLAVIGARNTGKTTLIHAWSGDWIDEPPNTLAPELREKVKLTVDGLRLTFTNLADISGSRHAWPQWEDRVKESRYLLYLVNARMLAGYKMHPEETWERVEDDAGQIGKRWLHDQVHLCVIVVTHTDLDDRSGQPGYHDLIARQLEPIVLKMGGDRRVRIVTGSLVDPESAELVTSQVMKHIITHEKALGS